MDEYAVGLPVISPGQYHGMCGKSRAFESFIRDVGDSKSKHEEEKIINQELTYLKEHLSAPATLKKKRELLIRLIYCEILGHDASFGYIHGIKSAQQVMLLEKRTGYLAASIFLHKDHQLVVLLVNTLQKDLESTNAVAKSAALGSICRLMGAEMTPALLPLIMKALKDKRAEIRKKALMTVHWVNRIGPSLLHDIGKLLDDALSDRDPAVMSASLHMFHDLIKAESKAYRKYLGVFIQILGQIMEGKLCEFNFHGVQAPWIQIELLRILALLGKQDKSASDNMSAVLLRMINTLPSDCNIGCAVMFECIQTITTIYPQKPLLDIASEKASLFLTSNSSNMKCLGITAVTALVKLDSCYAEDPKRQLLIIDCLDDDDLTIRKKTLELLYKITNNENVTLVTNKLLKYLKSTTENYIKTEVATKLTELAEKYAPDSTWYIETINDIIRAAARSVPPQVIHRLMKLISTVENDEKRETVLLYIDVINKKSIPDSLIKISSWVVGEFAHLIQDSRPLEDILSHFVSLLDRKFTDPATQRWIVSAVCKLTARMGVYLPEARGIIDRYRTGFLPELRQRCHEINVLTTDMALMKRVVPLNDSDEDAKINSSLSFLDGFVSKALMDGARPYQPHIKSSQEASAWQEDKTLIHILPYEEPFQKAETPCEEETDKPQQPKQVSSIEIRADAKELAVITSQKQGPSGPTKVWGRAGYSGNKIKKEVENSNSFQGCLARSSKSSSGSGTESSLQMTPLATFIDPVTDVSSKEDLSVALFSGVASSKKSSSGAKSYELGESSGTEKITVPRPSEYSLFVINDDIIQRSDQHLLLHANKLSAEVPDSADILVVVPPERNESDNLQCDDLQSNVRSNEREESGLLVDFDTDASEKKLSSASDLGPHREREVPADHITESNNSDGDATHPMLQMETFFSNEEIPLQVSESFGSSPNEVTLPTCDILTELCSDSNVRLVWLFLHKPSELIVELKLTNHCQTRIPIENIEMMIEPPSNLLTSMNSKKLVVETLASLNTITHELALEYQYPALHMAFRGTIRYTISRTSKVLYFGQEIPTRELLRPLKISTEVFGQKWTSAPNDVRKMLDIVSSKPCEEFMHIIAKDLNLAVIEINGHEGIAAGTVLARDICLLHFSFLKNVEIWVKTTSTLLSEVIMEECISVLENCCRSITH